MESRNEAERDWNVATIIDGLARGGKYFYIDDNGDRHEIYKAANGEITADGQVDMNGKKQAYHNQGDIVMASIFKKEIFEKIKRVETIKTLPYRDEEVYEKMNVMAEYIHKKIAEKQKQGMQFDEAWDVVTEEMAMDIIANQKFIPHLSNVKSENTLLDTLRSDVNVEPTEFEVAMVEGNKRSITTPEVPGE